MEFQDRTEAGQRLAALLGAYAHRPDVLALALPRGGVPVAYEIAQTLGTPLDVIVVRKLGVPYEEELAMGAIALGGVRTLNWDVIASYHIPDDQVKAVTEREQRELIRREHLYRGNRPLPDLRGRTVILIDDGIATGATIRAAIAAVRQQQPARVIVAAPVAAASTCAELRGEADEVVCAMAPDDLYGIGLWYVRFPQVSDETVCALLAKAWSAASVPPPEARPTAQEQNGSSPS